MGEEVRSRFVGLGGRDEPAWLVATLAVVGFVGTLSAYALGPFEVSGGIVWVPFHAAVVGLSGACVVGTFRGGLLSAFGVAYAPFLGYHADHVFYGLSGRTVPERVAIFLEVDGLAALGLEALVVGGIGVLAGRTVRSAVSALGGRVVGFPPGDEH